MRTKKLSKKSKGRIFFVSIFTIGIMTAILYNVFTVWNKILELKSQKDFLTKELTNMEDEESYLKGEVEKLKDPDYIARYAREKYLFSKNGEFTIKIPE
jgi:cell division protein DivIC